MQISGLLVYLLAGAIGSAALAAPEPTAAPSPAARVPLLPRTADGQVDFSGLGAPIEKRTVPKWPVQIRADAGECPGAACDEWVALEGVFARAAKWMQSFPEKDLRFDAAVGLASLRQTVDGDALRSAFEHARAQADHDRDHPLRRLWDPTATATKQETSTWTVPADPAQRVNTNRVVHEAFYCRLNGWREQTLRYLCGPMRDGGGYYSTHAAWALDYAHRNGCITETEYDGCARELVQELGAAQPATLVPKKSLDVDLYAERLLVLALLGDPEARLNAWAGTLIGLQRSDGSWGVPAADEQAYYQYHTTMTATWALAEWYRRRVGQLLAP